MRTGIIIVDHGSRRAESNALLELVAAEFGKRFAARYEIVEPAHMELAEPSIATAYAACVRRGATKVVVTPYFLGPGKHWTSDIPRLTREAAQAHPGTTYHVTMPLGLDDLMLDLLAKRVDACANHAYICESCRGTIRSGEDGALTSAVEPSSPAADQRATTCNTCPYAAAGMPLPASTTA